MKKIFIKDIQKGDFLEKEQFAVKNYKRMVSRNNKPYVDIELADKSGSMRGKIWTDNLANCVGTKEGDVVEIDTTVEEFNDMLQFNINRLLLIKKYNTEDFIQSSLVDAEKMHKELLSEIKKIKYKNIKAFLENLFIKDEEFIERFKKAPAGFKLHHAYSGGLLEHILETIELSKGLEKKFPKLNKDLLTCGIILHDIGKVYEFEISTTIIFTKRGKLLGHIYLGTELIRNKVPKDFPKDLLDEIIHFILSHHGEPELGSPTRPMTTEAVALHALDLASAKIHMAYRAIHKEDILGEFTPYHRTLQTELYKSPYLEYQEGIKEDEDFNNNLRQEL